MIKKNTKIIFEDTGRIVEDLGGIPLSKGEIITLKKEGKEESFKVNDKKVECESQGDDLIANITYKLKKIK